MDDLFLILQRDDPLSLQTACGLLATAVSMGQNASVFLAYGALWQLVHEALDEGDLTCGNPTASKRLERARDSGSLALPSTLLAAAREEGRVHLFACSASCRILQLEPEALEKVDGIMGLAGFLAKVNGAQLIVI